MPSGLLVVKVGGSLFDLPDLGDRLRRWIADQDAEKILLVPGGGAAADVVRQLDRRHQLGEERAHWLALRALSLNAEFLADLLGCPIHREWPADPRRLFDRSSTLIADALAFARADEAAVESRLPHSWSATSDAIAARIAEVLGAGRLVLLKSAPMPAGMTWPEAARSGFVDSIFPTIVKRAGLRVEAVNLRQLSQ